MSKTIRQFKFKFSAGLAHTLGKILTETARRYNLSENVTVVPIPLHDRRQKWRGFNQSEILAQELAQPNKWEVIHLLSRIKETNQQSSLSKEDRLKNMRNCFRIAPNETSQLPRDVLLVDDICSTGSTLEEAAKDLKSAGIATVRAIVLARGKAVKSSS